MGKRKPKKPKWQEQQELAAAKKFEAWQAMVKQLETVRVRARASAMRERFQAEYSAPKLSRSERAQLKKQEQAKRAWWKKNRKRILAARRKKAKAASEWSKVPYPRPKKARDYGLRHGKYRSEATASVEPYTHT